MARKYELKARAERQEETRRRIVEAAVELHRTKGPARTTVSDVARLARVQRHTFYRHFPDERSLLLACSGLNGERNPLPDPGPWRELAGDERVRHGLGELYRYFARNEEMLASLVRDAEHHELLREIMRLRHGPAVEAARAALAEALPTDNRTQAILDLALDFRAWQRLRRSGLSNAEAVEAMVRSLRCQ